MSLLSLNGNVLCAIDVETTGLTPNYHEIVQLAAVPLTPNLDPIPDISPFNMYARPWHPERASPEAMAVNRLTIEELMLKPNLSQVADCWDEWFRALDLPVGKRLVVLAQNAAFDTSMIRAWLGEPSFNRYFERRSRDPMIAAAYLNDKASWQARPLPFGNVGLASLANKFGIDNSGHHDALNDCLVTAKVYRELLRME